MEKLSLLVFLTCGFTEVALFHLGFIQESSFVGSMTHLMGVQGLHPLIRESLTTFSESTSWLRCNTHALFFFPPAHGWHCATYPTLGFFLGLCSQTATTFGIQKSGEYLSIRLSPFRLFGRKCLHRGAFWSHSLLITSPFPTHFKTSS